MEGPRPLVDTIVAQATPPGVGAVAMIRLSGPRAAAVAGALMGCGGDAMAGWAPRHGHLRVLRDPRCGETLDRALVTLFPGPASYTGEDVVEISTHGGHAIPATLVEACIALGARPASPGEFTQRAYLNGKLDLTQAEAVADLVAARAPKARTVALHQLERGLGDRIAELRGQVIGLAALLVQHIDFPDEDEAPVPLGRIAEEAADVARQIDLLLATAPAGELLREGAVTVLAGRPNSGKSSLFNALVGTERAIVTEEPGTTRDAIEAVISVGGFPFRLVDTAGLRSGAGRVERLGIEVAHRYLEGADLVLYCQEAGSAMAGRDAEFVESLATPVVFVRTKWDLAERDEVAGDGNVPVSVKTGEGIGQLREALRDLVFRDVVENRDEVPVVTRRRQAGLLREAAAEIKAFGKALASGIPAEVASAHLKSAEMSRANDMSAFRSTQCVRFS
ncbi:MAG: tRNA uridine-5-carboxymethylaminomethyl(34) synthesis GTPase MnmE, partial [Gemmatimonadota bacterium]|nr:tRNA uridine-5-carboxymethylaminomethyl(34) synthesis GTPase MnmE [Gemmatimonadota bacterium]